MTGDKWRVSVAESGDSCDSLVVLSSDWGLKGSGGPLSTLILRFNFIATDYLRLPFALEFCLFHYACLCAHLSACTVDH